MAFRYEASAFPPTSANLNSFSVVALFALRNPLCLACVGRPDAARLCVQNFASCGSGEDSSGASTARGPHPGLSPELIEAGCACRLDVANLPGVGCVSKSCKGPGDASPLHPLVAKPCDDLLTNRCAVSYLSVLQLATVTPLAVSLLIAAPWLILIALKRTDTERFFAVSNRMW